MENFKRTEILIGKENMDVLSNAHILVVGVGGVGGYVVEMLARCGVGELTIVDFDVVSTSNINRQIIALSSTVGAPKVDVLKKRILEINPLCKVNAIFEKFTVENLDKILNDKIDFVVDAIDNLENKVLLAVEAEKRNLNIISAMGAGNRIGIPNFQICDVFKTYNDGLARKFRKMLKDNGVKKLKVAFSNETTIKTSERVVGSISYFPAMCGATIAGYVINCLINIC
ncbi:MAG: ThiF family adenylyltransferase [Christensenellales bacterium]